MPVFVCVWVCKWCWVDLQYMKTLSITTPPRKLFPSFRFWLQHYEDMLYMYTHASVHVCNVAEVQLLMRTSLPTHPKYPHNPVTVEMAFSSLSCFAVAKCWSTTPECLDTQDLEVLSFVKSTSCDILRACVRVWTHVALVETQRSCFPSAAQQRSCAESGNSWVFFFYFFIPYLCLWNRGMRHNQLTYIKFERLQGCLCFYSESSCALINLLSLQRVLACTPEPEKPPCVLFNMLQKQLQDGVYAWPALLCRRYIPSVRNSSGERGSVALCWKITGRGGSCEDGGREIIFHFAIVRVVSVRGRKSKAGFSFVIKR